MVTEDLFIAHQSNSTCKKIAKYERSKDCLGPAAAHPRTHCLWPACQRKIVRNLCLEKKRFLGPTYREQKPTWDGCLIAHFPDATKCVRGKKQLLSKSQWRKKKNWEVGNNLEREQQGRRQSTVGCIQCDVWCRADDKIPG